MHFPDYRGGSLVNLMSSIAAASGTRTRYPQLKALRAKELDHRNVVLLLVDGLGYEFARANATLLAPHLRGSMTSVFPSTTAACVTSLLTGEAPQQHGITGWFMHARELAGVTVPLHCAPRVGNATFAQLGIPLERVYGAAPLALRMKREAYAIIGEDLLASPYNDAFLRGSKALAYTTPDGLFRQVRRAVTSSRRRKYVYAYWPMLDALGHAFGCGSDVFRDHFRALEARISRLIASLAGTDTLLIVTGDHGMVDAGRHDVVWVHEHPQLEDALTLPLCGEPRAAYCYVRPARAKAFEGYVRAQLSHACTLVRSDALIARGAFGLGKAHPLLAHRVGDYVLLMKGSHIVRNVVLGEAPVWHRGNHGGVSREEMLVPLIVARA